LAKEFGQVVQSGDLTGWRIERRIGLFEEIPVGLDLAGLAMTGVRVYNRVDLFPVSHDKILHIIESLSIH